MSDKLTFAAEPRTSQGSGPVGRLRRDGKLPGVVYSAGQPGRPIQVDAHEFNLLLQHHTGESLLLDLHVTGEKPCMALLRDVQHHPVNGGVLHIDLHEVSAKSTLQVPVAVELVGEPVGVTQEGGVLEQLLHNIEISCLPADLVEKFTVDVSGLEIGSRISASDLALDPEKHTLITGAEVAVAMVTAPRVADEDEVDEEGEEGVDAAGVEGDGEDESAAASE